MNHSMHGLKKKNTVCIYRNESNQEYPFVLVLLILLVIRFAKNWPGFI